MTKSILTREIVRKHLVYNLITGDFFWATHKKERNINKCACRAHNGGYWQIYLNGSSYLAHRLAFMYMLGCIPEEVDHINHIRNDNRWINLRSADGTINQKNTKLSANNTSGFNGVSWKKRYLKWQARIKVDRQSIFLGYFSNKDDAINARKSANIKYGFHENHGRSL